MKSVFVNSTQPNEKTLGYYKAQGVLSSLGKYTEGAQELPGDPLKLSEIVQGIILHDMWIAKYNVTPKTEQWCNALSPSVEDLLDTVVGVDQGEPFNHREPGDRVIACCREFSTMLCGILRAKGIPARARCGFAPYLAKEGFYEDHWMCEAWNGTSWQRVDPQIDSFQLKVFHDYAKEHSELGADYREMLMEFDPQNLKPGDFMIAGEAWQKCRSGDLSPNTFGIGVDLSKYGLRSPYGLWFIRGNLIRDFLALNKIELLPFVEGLEKTKIYWDDWTMMQPDAIISDEDMTLLDKISELTSNPDENLQEIQQLYTNSKQLHPPKSILAS
jgi:hypothetical protein